MFAGEKRGGKKEKKKKKKSILALDTGWIVVCQEQLWHCCFLILPFPKDLSPNMQPHKAFGQAYVLLGSLWRGKQHLGSMRIYVSKGI